MGPISKYNVMIASHNRATVKVWLQHTQVTAHNHSFSHSSDSRVIEKQTKTNRGRGGPSMMYVSFFLKKCWDILQFFLLIKMAVWNIKQTIMKDYNIQSCQWMACDCFRQPFLLCLTFHSFLCTVHYFPCVFSAKMAIYSLVMDNVHFVISS